MTGFRYQKLVEWTASVQRAGTIIIVMNDRSSSAEKPLYERIYAIVRQVPPGRVVTYGQIATMVGGCSARMVGYAMAALHSGTYPDVPWQRVINRSGKISIHDPFGKYRQRELLEAEGVYFDQNDQVDFKEFGWVGPP